MSNLWDVELPRRYELAKCCINMEMMEIPLRYETNNYLCAIMSMCSVMEQKKQQYSNKLHTFPL
jgi:hypothetical protein